LHSGQDNHQPSYHPLDPSTAYIDQIGSKILTCLPPSSYVQAQSESLPYLTP